MFWCGVVACVWLLICGLSVLCISSLKPKCSLTELYRMALSEYLVQHLHLDAYDETLWNDHAGYVCNDEQVMSLMQRQDFMGLMYFFLGNNIRLERLNETAFHSLVGESKLYDGTISDTMFQLVKQTMGQVTMLTDDDIEVLRGMTDRNRAETEPVVYQSIVLVISVQTVYDENGNVVDPEGDARKHNELLSFASRMEYDLDGMLGPIPVRVCVEK